MPESNTSEIQARYNEQLARLYYSVDYTSDDVLSYALMGKNLDNVGIITVDSLNDLPNLDYSIFPDGMVYFVQTNKIIVISSNKKWLTLDGVVLRTDAIFGLAFSWGSNGFGRLGDGTITTRSSPATVVGATDWCQISAGYHSLGIRSNGTAWAWGRNSKGKLGDNTTVNKSSPVSVVGGFTDWCQISAGYCHSLGVRTNGSAWAWGSNGAGELGTNNTISRSSPVSVIGGFTDWCQVSGGYQHSLGVRQGGTAWAWGLNSFGKLGDNTLVSKRSPVQVVGGFTNWSQVSAGRSHSLGVRTNGSAWAWGYGGQGRLGNNAITSRRSPIQVLGGFTDWSQVSAGTSHSLGVRTNGSAWAWGLNTNGQLGRNETGTGRSSPVSIVGGFTDWSQVSGGGAHSLGVRTNGSAWAWGYNGQGRLGDNTTVNKSSPVSVVSEFTDWSQVSAGFVFSLGVVFGC